MKKKLIVAVALIVIVAFSVTLFSGCDEIFKRNDVRDNTQIVATVNYKGDFDAQVDYVYKYELASSFNSAASVYHSYYGMGYEEIADYLLRSLAQQKLLVMFAKDRVAKLLGLTAIPKDTGELLSLAERDKAIKDANESLLSAVKSQVTSDITEDKYNSGVNTGEAPKEEEPDEELGEDTVTVRFDAQNDSEVEKVKVNKNSKVKAIDDPTRDGYTFYGWHEAQLDEGGKLQYNDKNEIILKEAEFDFETKLSQNVSLYAMWKKFTTPRTEMPKVEEEEDEDYDPDVNEGVTLTDKFFSDAYQATLLDEIKKEDIVEDVRVPENSTLDVELQKYIDSAVDQIVENLKKNLYLSTVDECYDYYLNNQYESLLVTRLERMLGESATVSQAEIDAEFARIVEQNKLSYRGSTTAYSSALTSSLSQTFYHPEMENGSYGFVVNILLKLDDEKLDTLLDFYNNNRQDNKELVKIRRNQLLSEITVKVSNPNYDSEAVIEDANGDEIELKDPMTDTNNPYGYFGVTGDYDHSKQFDLGEGKYNNYDQLLNFKYNEESQKYEIVFQATEHPAMAYLLEEVPAFDVEGKPGIIHQIYTSFEQVTKEVKDGRLSPIAGAYWLRELATKWAYLVGDDSGAVTSSSNNNGLGYLISPEGQDSSYLEDFTAYARNLVKAGTGSYCYTEGGDEIGNADFAKASAKGEFAGNNRAFVVADSFIESGSTSNAYAGVFVLLNSYTVWDDAFYNEYTKTAENPQGNRLDAATGCLPQDYVITFAENADDVKTLKEIVEQSFLDAKKADIYSFVVNNMGVNHIENIEYNRKAYKSLYKDLD